MTVTRAQLQVLAGARFANVDHIAAACNRTFCPLFLAAAMLDKESDGKNIFGHDHGGAMTGYPGDVAVTADSYTVFRWMIDVGVPIQQPDGTYKIVKFGPNGVGPAQITHPELVAAMATEGLDIRNPKDNIFFGVRRLFDFYQKARETLGVRKSIVEAGRRYNGKLSYGEDLLTQALKWKDALGNADYA